MMWKMMIGNVLKRSSQVNNLVLKLMRNSEYIRGFSNDYRLIIYQN